MLIPRILFAFLWSLHLLPVSSFIGCSLFFHQIGHHGLLSSVSWKHKFLFRLAGTTTPSSSQPHLDNELSEDVAFEKLYSLVQPDHQGLLRLDKSNTTGIRGVYVNRNVRKGSTLLSVPLELCLRDDKPPKWFFQNEPPTKAKEYIEDNNNGITGDEEGGNDNNNNSNNAQSTPTIWSTRLAASFLDLQFRLELDAAQEEKQILHEAYSSSLWVSLLPDSSSLQASLPVHWSDDVLVKTKCTALQLAVDSSFFARAQAVQDLMDSLDNCEAANVLNVNIKHARINNALNLVQTRSCRIESTTVVVVPRQQQRRRQQQQPQQQQSDAECIRRDNNNNSHTTTIPIRLLAPIFDFLNHNTLAVNAEFGTDQDVATTEGGCITTSPGFVVVRALQDIAANNEVFIDYGNSARPDWRCLLSYGFVPRFEPDMSIPKEEDDFRAELLWAGQRYEVGPESVPEDLVYVMAQQEIGNHLEDDAEDRSKVVLTPKIALQLSEIIREAATAKIFPNDSQDREGTKPDYTLDDTTAVREPSLVEGVISEKLAASLRWNQHMILMTCSIGLRTWALNQS